MGCTTSHDICDGILDPVAPCFRRKKARLNKVGKYICRVNRQSWWKEELPSEAEYAKAYRTLNFCDWKVDNILTHCAPSSIV